MSKLIVISLLLLVSCVACSNEPTKEASPEFTPTPKPAPVSPKIAYTQGFFDEEHGGGGETWRWMGPEGVIRLKNTGQDAVLTLQGSSPVEPLKGAPTVKITFNGEVLDQFPGDAKVQKKYSIPAGKQAPGEYSELRISSSKSFVPQEVDKKFQDSRRLAFQITKLTWD